MSNILNNYQKKYKDISNDFFKFWYEQIRFQYRPVVGYTLKEYHSKNFNVNKEGFRSKKDYFERLQNNKKKIFFFGSSALVGIPNLADDGTISSLVEKYLDQEYECYNFGLIASKINSEFSLFQQVITENKPDFVVLYTGYNDLNAAYHGHRFEYYDDINSILKIGFEFEKKKTSIIYSLEQLLDSIINKIDNLIKIINKKDSSLIMVEAQNRRRKILKEKNISHTYDLSREVYVNYLELFLYLCKQKNIKIIYIHQPSLLTTDKELSEYEKEYYKSHKELGLYKNSDLSKDQIEFKKNYEIFKNDSHDICKKLNSDFIDFEKILLNEYKKENIFYDNVHLTNVGSEILSKIITNKISNQN